MARLPTSTSPVSMVLFSKRNILPTKRKKETEFRKGKSFLCLLNHKDKICSQNRSDTVWSDLHKKVDKIHTANIDTRTIQKCIWTIASSLSFHFDKIKNIVESGNLFCLQQSRDTIRITFNGKSAAAHTGSSFWSLVAHNRQCINCLFAIVTVCCCHLLLVLYMFCSARAT